MRFLSVCAFALAAGAVTGCSESGGGSAQNIQGSDQSRDEVIDDRNQTPEDLMALGRGVRMLDGSRNNEQKLSIGATFTTLRRIAEPDYADGVSALAGPLRISARAVSNIVVDQGSENIPNEFGTSDFLWQWGQFLDHDIDLTDGVASSGPNPRAADIAVPSGDPFFDPTGEGDRVIEFNRAIFDPTTGSSPQNPRQQENEITAWIDASNVYGSSEVRLAAIRVGPDSPFMKLDDTGLLPRNTDNLANANGPALFPQTLFLAGDVRANEQVALASMHTLFVREHNRLAQIVLERFPFMTPNEVFFVTRRLVGAEMQRITYNEFLPALIGPNAIPPYQAYNPAIDGSIINEFSVAAFRVGHTMLSPVLRRLDASLQTIPAGDLPLRNAFFRSPELLTTGADIDPILRGLANQLHQKIDAKLIGDVRNFLFGAPGSGGFDLAALNIQRGRDHGVPSYNDVREAVGLPRVTDFDQISSDPDVQFALAQAYGTVDDIDLWVGGVAEDALVSEGSQLGPLFREILIMQFTRLRDGDRFWYEIDLSPAEKEIIAGLTLGRIIKLNTGIGDELSDDVFRVPTN